MPVRLNALVRRLALRVGGLLLALLLQATAGTAAALPQYADAIGGAGGQKYNLGCGGDVLVGLEMRQGDAIDRMSLYCAPLHKGGGIGDQYLRDKYVGGEGGTPTHIACPQGQAVVGLSVVFHGNDVNNVSLKCLNMDLGTVADANHPYSPDSGLKEAGQPTLCPDGYLATGTFGSADNIVHSVGLRCDQNPFAFKPQPNSNNTPNTNGNWSAFAASNNGNWGFATFQESQQTASKLALSGCGGSGAGCNVFWTTQNTCVAYADTRDPQYLYAAGGGDTEQQAIGNALKFCQSGKAAPGSCIIQKSGCR